LFFVGGGGGGGVNPHCTEFAFLYADCRELLSFVDMNTEQTLENSPACFLIPASIFFSYALFFADDAAYADVNIVDVRRIVASNKIGISLFNNTNLSD